MDNHENVLFLTFLSISGRAVDGWPTFAAEAVGGCASVKQRDTVPDLKVTLDLSLAFTGTHLLITGL